MALQFSTKTLIIPQNLKIFIKQDQLLLLEKNQKLLLRLPSNLLLTKKNNNLVLSSTNTYRNSKLTSWFVFFKNLFQGLNSKISLYLVLKGLGYKVFFDKQKNLLTFRLGYSHPLIVSTQEHRLDSVDVYKNTILKLSSYSQEKLGKISFLLRKLRKLNTYKGKGILFRGEKINLKIGKKT